MAAKLMSVSGAAAILDLSEDIVPESNPLHNDSRAEIPSVAASRRRNDLFDSGLAVSTA